MPEKRSSAASLVVIAVVVGCSAAAFAYTGGWFSPERLSPDTFADAFKGPHGQAVGHRINHAKGICFTGTFDSSGAGTALSKAQVFSQGQYPVLGRFSIATPDFGALDAKQRVQGFAMRIATPDGQQWRMAMIDAPFFPVSKPEEMYQLTAAAGSADPKALPDFVGSHPNFQRFLGWAKSAPWNGSYAEDRYNSLNAFLFTDASGTDHAVRWSLLPTEPVVPVTPDDLAKLGPDFLEQEIMQRVGNHPVKWNMVVTVANPDDQITDPNQPWPEDRKTVQVGTLTISRIEAEADGPCRDIVFDPTILPDGIRPADPFPAARSAVYQESFNRREAEADKYPREAKP